MVLKYVSDSEKQGTALIFKSELITGDAESLAWESAAEDVVTRYFPYAGRARENIDVAIGKVTKALEVADSGKFVLLTGEDARSSGIFTSQAEPSDACE